MRSRAARSLRPKPLPQPLTPPEPKPYRDAMKRLLTSLVVGYVVLALYCRAREAAGLMTCDCYPDCWCRQPGLGLFRWVFPRFHHNPASRTGETDSSARLGSA